MTTISKLFLCLFVVASLSFAQAVTTNTTLNASMGRSDTSVNLVSSTGVLAAGVNNQVTTGGYIDREYLTFTTNANSLGAGNIWNVKRGVAGILSSHASGTTVWIGPPSVFDLGANDRIGVCTATSFQYLPLVMVRSGNVLGCNGSYTRLGGFGDFSVGPIVASATTVVITSNVVHVSGTTAIVNITATGLPVGGNLTFIPDGAWSTTAAGNIGIATAPAVVGKALILTFDGLKFWPSY